jgi:hypothetical protein
MCACGRDRNTPTPWSFAMQFHVSLPRGMGRG